jgi:hypothetical protein
MSIPVPARTRRLRLLSYAILVAGLLAALVIYKTAAPPPDDPLGNPEDNKQSLRELEMYGGQANVFAYEIRHWLGSLWQGPRLAFTVAVLAAIVAGGCRLAAIPLPSHEAGGTGGRHGPSEEDSG